MIELRSDTFTLPTKKMLKMSSEALLGDDVYGEDPTVNKLELLAANLLGKEASCLMPSGTMANLTSIMVHCPRGSKVLVGDSSDIYIYEAGGASVCGGIMYEPIPTQHDGRLLLEDLEEGFPEDMEDPQYTIPSLICIENPNNRCGGTVLAENYLQDLYNYAHSKGVKVHMDGARIFNAAIALDQAPAELAKFADSLQFCLSKGLAAPIGSMVVGDKEFISKVKRVRKMLGGGMRQAGIIAAAGIVALEDMIDRLKEDHDNAMYLAQGLSKIPGIVVDLEKVQTNIVIFELTNDDLTCEELVEKANKKGLNIGTFGSNRIRAVTYFGISKEDIDNAIEILFNILNESLKFTR